MARFEILSVVIFAVVLAILSEQATALKCWNCDSQAQSYCGLSFDKSKLSSTEKDSRLTTCAGTKCYRIVASVKGDVKRVDRACAVSDQAAQDQCTAVRPPNTKDEDYKCETSTCDKDGCNGAAQYGPIALLTILPMAIAKFLPF